MDIKCPHCGTEYEVEKQDMYRYTKCEVCGKGFVIGATSSLLAESSAAQTSSGNPSMTRGTKSQPQRCAVPRSRPFANINKTPTRPNFRQQKPRSTNAVMWFSIGGVCLVLVIALAVVFAARGNRHGQATEIAASEEIQQSDILEKDEEITIASKDDITTSSVDDDVVVTEEQKSNSTGKESSDDLYAAEASVDPVDEDKKESSGDKMMAVVERLCGGERLTSREWQKRIRKEIGIDRLYDKLKDELARAGYWAIRVESSGMLINIGYTSQSTTGFIREGLDGGFTYPEWFPEEDARYIYKSFWKLDAEEKSLWKIADAYTEVFKASDFYITPEEEERIEQAARLEFAKPLFSSISFVEKPYLCIQSRLWKSVISAKVTDRRWKLLSDAQANEDWLGMMNIISDENAEKLKKYPDKKKIAALYKNILNHKWNVEIKLRNTGVRPPSAGDMFREISHYVKIGKSENEIKRHYSAENYDKYKKFSTAMKSMNSEELPYPIDVEVSINKVSRDGDVHNIRWCQCNGLSRRDGGNTGTFQFTISDGAVYLLYVDDDWFWKQHCADTLRAKMSSYVSKRNKYYSEVSKLADAVKNQQYGESEAKAKRKEICERFHGSLWDAIANFMGKKTVPLPPMPKMLEEKDDDLADAVSIAVSGADTNRFLEYEKEMKDRDRMEQDENERAKKERNRQKQERAAEARRLKREKYRLKGPQDFMR